MIPKIIHYCWFGRNPLPNSAKKCIASWKKFFPNYEIIEWNEENFDINSFPYIVEAYNAKKYAFVSDYARFKILHEHGGLYFDTDVEVIKNMDNIISAGPFMGFEINPCKSRKYGAVNPGLGLCALPGMKIYENILQYYKQLHFVLPDGSYNIKDAVVNITTRELVKAGLINKEGIQQLDELVIYPSEFFNPFDDATGKLNITSNTYSIHWYSKTWMDVSHIKQFLSRIIHRCLGTDIKSKFNIRRKK